MKQIEWLNFVAIHTTKNNYKIFQATERGNQEVRKSFTLHKQVLSVKLLPG